MKSNYAIREKKTKHKIGIYEDLYEAARARRDKSLSKEKYEIAEQIAKPIYHLHTDNRVYIVGTKYEWVSLPEEAVPEL